MGLPVILRRESEQSGEQRTPLTPEGARLLVNRGVRVIVERSSNRAFADEQYRAAGAEVTDKAPARGIVIGIAPPTLGEIEAGQCYLIFSLTRKGQAQRMPLIKELMNRSATLIDYELISDETGRRTLAFGRFGGIAGSIDAFWLAGKKLALRGSETPLLELQQARCYGNLHAAKRAVSALSPLAVPLRVLITGSGNVGQGSREVCQWIGLPEIDPDRVLQAQPPPGPWFCLLDIEDIVEENHGAPFDLVQYLAEGKNRYQSSFSRYLGRFDILLQGMYWDERYPKQLPQATLRERRDALPLLIADISCDLNGSLESTMTVGTIDQPAYTYLPESHTAVPGLSAEGLTVLAIENFANELAADSSEHFSRILSPLLVGMIDSDLGKPLGESGLSQSLQRAAIVYTGQLTPRFEHLLERLP